MTMLNPLVVELHNAKWYLATFNPSTTSLTGDWDVLPKKQRQASKLNEPPGETLVCDTIGRWWIRICVDFERTSEWGRGRSRGVLRGFTDKSPLPVRCRSVPSALGYLNLASMYCAEFVVSNSIPISSNRHNSLAVCYHKSQFKFAFSAQTLRCTNTVVIVKYSKCHHTHCSIQWMSEPDELEDFLRPLHASLLSTGPSDLRELVMHSRNLSLVDIHFSQYTSPPCVSSTCSLQITGIHPYQCGESPQPLAPPSKTPPSDTFREISSPTVTLGTRTHIPSGHIVNTLWAQTTCGPNVPSGYILITFKIYPPMWPKCVCRTYSEFVQPLWPQFAQWSHDLSHSKFAQSCDQHVHTQSHPKCSQFIWPKCTQWAHSNWVQNVHPNVFTMCPVDTVGFIRNVVWFFGFMLNTW